MLSCSPPPALRSRWSNRLISFFALLYGIRAFWSQFAEIPFEKNAREE